MQGRDAVCRLGERDGTVDVRLRHNGESETVPLAEAADRIAALHANLMPSVSP